VCSVFILHCPGDVVTGNALRLLVLQYTDQEMIPARNERIVVTLAEVIFVTIQRENILPSKK
jgi:hypothetical protein